MTQKRSTKRAFWMSALSLLLCVSMLVGTTYAWFTDSVVSGMNTIMAGNLDVELLADGKKVTTETKLFDDVALWEPGVVVYENLQVVNEGTLALQWQMGMNFGRENELEGHKLSEVLKVAVIDKIADTANRQDVLAAAKAANATSLYNFYMTGTLEAGESATEQGVVIFWEPGENDNLYNANNGKTTSNGNPLGITFGIKLVATQVVSEKDGFGNEYDENAGAEFFDGFQGGNVGVAVKTDDQGLTTAEVAQAGGDVAVKIPAGVKVKDGVSTLKLSVTKKDHADANVQLNENEEMRPLDVHIEGVAEGNTVPMLITLKHYLSTGINTGALRLYHVENGAPVAMTQVATPTAHNEFSYDPATGDLVLAMASFSEVATIADSTNPWDGKTATAFAGGRGTKDNPYIIADAGQLAYFRDAVDGGNDFEGKTVKLNNNIYLDEKNFDPIGWGYANTKWNAGGVAGKPFEGTFDGGQYDENGNLVGRYTIFDLYQHGWDLETGDKDYTYTNCGFGLFASASNATFKNLTISGAEIRTECVEMGVLVGLSQNNCTYNNIKILDSKIANYQRPAGGLIGEVSGAGTTTITNVTIGDDVVVGSLWGDFDAPCGGVIGARWDDVNANPQIEMKNVEVGCRLDVYNDITSAYQWHAYRRAGMLIGNTELTEENDPHKAAAPFLTCVKDENGKETVKVYYGDWVDYTYCEFSNEQNPGRNYPWVRVQAGENNPAYSNPRYGHPVDKKGNSVTGDHDESLHQTGEGHELLRKFGQLYGGGQGVYGQDEHDGVTVPSHYSITYVNDNKVLDIIYVTDNKNAVSTTNYQAQKLVEEWAGENITGSWKFGGWMNAGSTKVPTVKAGNDKDIVLYPYFNKPYTARFVDQQGNVVAYCFFHKEDTTKLNETKTAAEAALPDPGEDLEFDYWQVQLINENGKLEKAEPYDISKFDDDNYQRDITIYPVYLYQGDVELIPVDKEPKDGIIDEYQVGGYSDPAGQALVRIPGSVNGIQIVQINENAFSDYDGVHAIVVPNGVTIQKNAFTEGTKFGRGEEITIYFEGTKDQWNKLTKETGWDYGIGTGSRVFFLKDSKVDTTQGYLEVVDEGWFLSHDYQWSEKSDFSSVKKNYSGKCDCSTCKKSNLDRPDKQYWEGV